jgi:3-oxoacyl-[acyl-carrier protein] reductase
VYGRYWGALEHVPLLHFECCYYSPIEYAISKKLEIFEGGAQGEHKIFRGLMPVETLSAHWLAHPRFARAVEQFLEREGAGIARYVDELRDHSPFRQEGARVIVNDINAAGEKVAKEVGGKFVQADVTQASGWERMVTAAGPELAIVVNNAGWTHRRKAFLDVTEAEFDRVYAVNVKSIYLSARHVLPVFRKRGGGAFVNIASTAGIRPRPGLTVYNSSKGAVITLSKSMAAEFGPDQVRVNCVNPVFSPETALSADFAGGTLSEEAKKGFLATIPLGRFSTPLDIANACLYLASDEASLISGVCIEVDGARCV